jgi:dUTPase
VIAPVSVAEPVEVGELPESAAAAARGAGGFGSTGR